MKFLVHGDSSSVHGVCDIDVLCTLRTKGPLHMRSVEKKRSLLLGRRYVAEPIVEVVFFSAGTKQPGSSCSPVCCCVRFGRAVLAGCRCFLFGLGQPELP